MAPAPLATANRPLVKPSKIRYFKGKAPDAALSGSELSDDDEEDQQQARRKKQKSVAVELKDESLVAGGAGRIVRQGEKLAGVMKMHLGDVKVGGKAAPVKQEEESEEEETDEEEEEKPAYRASKPPGEESSEYETASEESEEEQKPAFRPVFTRKDQRGMTQEKAAKMAEEAAVKEEEMQQQRKLDSKELAGETIRRELAEKEATDLQPDIDDTDGLDPSSEFDAWRARELARLLRDKQAQAARDEEQEEIERRRAMPEEQRLREDMEYAEGTRAREKGQMGFLQKYYHKGAFHQDDDLLGRDYTLATESQVDMSMLPKVMQVRDFGKMSRTKYTHLTDQDTSQGGWGAAARPVVSGGVGNIGTTETGCWNCGGPHMRKDCPNNNINDAGVLAGMPGSGNNANTSALGSGSRGWAGGGGSYESGGRDERGGYDYGSRGQRPDAGGGSRSESGNGAGRYMEEGRERRYGEERRNDGHEPNQSGPSGGGSRREDHGYGRNGGDRDGRPERDERYRGDDPAPADSRNGAGRDERDRRGVDERNDRRDDRRDDRGYDQRGDGREEGREKERNGRRDRERDRERRRDGDRDGRR